MHNDEVKQIIEEGALLVDGGGCEVLIIAIHGRPENMIDPERTIVNVSVLAPGGIHRWNLYEDLSFSKLYKRIA